MLGRKFLSILEDIRHIDLIEETDRLEDEDGRQHCLLQEEFSKKVLHEEIKWKQRSRNKWVEEGDHNIIYFHAHRRVKWITVIIARDQLWKSKKDIETEVVSFNQNLHIGDCKNLIYVEFLSTN